MRHQSWLGSAESLTLYAKLSDKWASLQAGEMKAFFDMEQSGPLGASLLEVQGPKAVLNIQGSLVNADAWWHPFAAGEVTSYAAIKGAVSLIAANADIKDVIVNVSSGGGSLSGLSSASKAIKSLSKIKKVTGYTEDVAASAGYWLLSSAPKVYASETAEVGSIGVIAMYQDITKALEENGIKYHVIKAGKHKDYGASVTDFSEDELEYLQTRVDHAHQFFIKHVSTARKLPRKNVDNWGDAQVFFAQEAMDVGLVDEVADFSDILTSISKSEHTAMTYTEKLAMIASGAAPEDVLTAEELNTFNESEEVQAEDTVTEEVQAEVAEPQQEQEQPDYSLAVKLGRAEARLEDTEAKLAALQGKLDLASAQTASLLNVAQAAVGNLQIALQKPKEVKGTADEVITQFETLKTELSTRFPSGRKSVVKENEEMDFSAQIPDPYQSY